MVCMKCGKDMAACQCPDIEERLRSLERNPNTFLIASQMRARRNTDKAVLPEKAKQRSKENVVVIDRKTGEPADHPANREAAQMPRNPKRTASSVAEQIRDVVPDKYKPLFITLLREDFAYKPPEQLQTDPACWLKLVNLVNRIIPHPDVYKLKEEWEIKTVALLTNKTEAFVKKHFAQKEGNGK